MGTRSFSEYVLTVVQHTCCDDCNRLKGKFADVYIASGIARGEDSKHWLVQLLAASSEVEHGHHLLADSSNIEVPSLKLEADGKVVFDIEDATLIEELLGRLKWMLVNHNSNDQIRTQLATLIDQWGHRSFAETAVSSVPLR